MLRSVKHLYGDKLRASDGEIGQVKDFYFDDQHWAVRYIVANTGSWLSGCLVLISPHAFGSFSIEDDCLLVNLTKLQVQNSPATESHKTVSCQYEEEYHRYYGWPTYWEGGGMSGVDSFPMAPPPYPQPSPPASADSVPHQGDDPHLRSTQSLHGYHIQTQHGPVGHVTDVIFDDKSWAICHLVIETGHWFSGKEIVLSPKQIDCISCEESKVFVSVTREAIVDASPYLVPS